MTGGVVDQPCGNRPGMVPDGSAGSGVEGVGVIGGGHEHDAVHHHWRDLQAVRVVGMEDPLSPKLSDIGGVDLRQTAVTAPCEISVVRKPICSGRLSNELSGKDVDHRRSGFIGWMMIGWMIG